MKELKERTVRLKLSDEECENILRKAGMVGLTVEELLENFICDFTDSDRSNGSDERELAYMWYERCGFGSFPNENTFLSYLIENNEVDSILSLVTDLESSKGVLAEAEEDLKNGFMKDNLRGETYTWKDLIYSDGTPSYSSMEEWEEETRADIESEKEYIKRLEEDIEEYCNDYMKIYSPKTDFVFEDELSKIREWKECADNLLDA